MLFPKNKRKENRHLLDMARGKPCLLNAVLACEGSRGDTTVAAHSNWSDLGGKGWHRKSDDSYIVNSCYTCHSWLDQGSASKETKRTAWLLGHQRQIEAWRDIVNMVNGNEKQKDIEAAIWALEKLME
jgi:hypothetical protein